MIGNTNEIDFFDSGQSAASSQLMKNATTEISGGGCSIDQNLASPTDSISFFRDSEGHLVNFGGSTAPIGTRVIFECSDSKLKTAYRECLVNNQWSIQSKTIVCDKWRYWAAVIAAATSAFVIVILIVYFTCAAYNKRKKRKYIARTERRVFYNHCTQLYNNKSPDTV